MQRKIIKGHFHLTNITSDVDNFEMSAAVTHNFISFLILLATAHKIIKIVCYSNNAMHNNNNNNQ